MTEEAQLLREYVTARSEAAFRQLVDRYVNLVYAAARRQVRDGDLARDVTQAVFLVLAEKAGELDPARPISAWLLQVTRYASANAVRARARRAHHEQRAAEMLSTKTTNDRSNGGEWEQLSPLLDEGMGRLRSKDRDVLLLRFFERKTAREVAEAMGISEDAAEKRIARAVGKLRDFFQRRGVAVSVVALTTTLAAYSAEAAPIGLTASIAASATSAATSSAATLSAGAIAKGTVVTMATAKAKTIFMASLALLLIGGGAVTLSTMVASSKPRRVVVAPAQPATMVGATSTAAAVPGAHTLQFSQGTTVELLGISDAPTNNARWWAPDGTTATPPAKRPGAGLRAGGGQPSFQLLLRKVDGPSGGGGMTVQLKDVNISGASSTDQPDGAGGRLHSYMFALWDNTAPPIVDVAVSLAYGPWSDEQRFALDAPSATTSSQPAQSTAATNPSAAPALTINKVRDAGKGITEVDFRFSSAARDRSTVEEQIFLVDAAGRQFFMQSWNGYPFGRNVLEFNVPRANVVALVYRSRPYETREIRNVSLRPGQKTVVAISDAVRR